MNLIALVSGNADPGLINGLLLQHFFGVAVDVAGNGDIFLLCHDDGGRCRLALRYQWSEAVGWIYSILPQRRRPRRPYRSGDVKYLPDGSYTINP